MEKTEKNNSKYYTIDLMQVLKAMWHRAWVILLAGVLAAALGFGISAFVIAPQYSSSVLLYVNNSDINLGNTSFNISQSDIVASQSLVKTYSVILKNRTTLERVIQKTGVSYDYEQLSDMIQAGSEQETEIMRVTVTGEDPYEAAEIANCIAEVLPARITEIIDGASMEVVDDAEPNLQKVSPSITNYTAIGLLLGLLLSAGTIAVITILDDTIQNEEYILQTYDYPILAKIPNLLDSSTSHYGKYYRDKRTAPYTKK